MAEIITRKEALDRGLDRYFTGKPCKHGHVAERRVIDKTCIVCRCAADARRRAEHRELFRERGAAYRAANPTNTPEYRAKMAAYREANREVLRAYNSEYQRARRARKKAEAATALP